MRDSQAYVEGGNWLVGLSGGYARHTGDMTIGVVYPTFNNHHIDKLANGHGDDWNKGLFFGYRWICNGWIWDGEFNIDLYQTESDFFFRLDTLPGASAIIRPSVVINMAPPLGSLADGVIPCLPVSFLI